MKNKRTDPFSLTTTRGISIVVIQPLTKMFQFSEKKKKRLNAKGNLKLMKVMAAPIKANYTRSHEISALEQTDLNYFSPAIRWKLN